VEIVLYFPEKEARSDVLRRFWGTYPHLGEADPGGLGACPQINPKSLVDLNLGEVCILPIQSGLKVRESREAELSLSMKNKAAHGHLIFSR
jgi:hypothetical protein